MIRRFVSDVGSSLRFVNEVKVVNAFVLVIAYIGASVRYLLSNPPDLDIHAAQFKMQSLDLEWIRQNFWECLTYNHFNPPLYYNLIIGPLYKFIPAHGGVVALALNYIVSIASFGAFLYVLNRLRIHQVWVLVTGFLYVLYPLRWIWETQMFYPMIEAGFLMLMLFCFCRFLAGAGSYHFGLGCLFAVLLTLIHAFFHMLWAVAIAGTVFCLYDRKRTLGLTVCLVVTCLAAVVWPLKNWAVFGFFASSSGLGMMLAVRAAIPKDIIREHVKRGDITDRSLTGWHSPETYLRSDFPVPEKFSKIQCLAKPWKEYGLRSKHFRTFNYNYYPVIPSTEELEANSYWLMKKYPKFYVSQTPIQFVNFFSGSEQELSVPIPFAGRAHFRRTFSGRGLLYVLSVIGGMFYLMRAWRRRQSLAYRMMALIMMSIGYSLFVGVVISSANYESVRYRFIFETTYLALSAWCLNYFLPLARFSRFAVRMHPMHHKTKGPVSKLVGDL